MSEQSILQDIDPALLEEPTTRADALRRGAMLGAGLALAALPFGAGTALASGGGKFTGVAGSGHLPSGRKAPSVTDVLNYALTLEYLESTFYNMAVGTNGLIPSGTPQKVFSAIRHHENQHVMALKSVLGGKATAKPTFDFTAGGKFQPFKDYKQFLLLSQAFEDTGVRAYKGQLGSLVANSAPTKVLTAAVTIHSVEARHAARVRAMNGLDPWIPLDQPGAPKPVAAVYATDPLAVKDDPANNVLTTTKYGVNVAQVASEGRKPVTEAFDEALSMPAVLKIVSPFIKSH